MNNKYKRDILNFLLMMAFLAWRGANNTLQMGKGFIFTIFRIKYKMHYDPKFGLYSCERIVNGKKN